MKKVICLIVPKILPVPAVLGGAIETLVTLLLEENEKDNRVRFVVFSPYNENAEILSKSYRNSEVIYIREPNNIKVLVFCVK